MPGSQREDAAEPVAVIERGPARVVAVSRREAVRIEIRRAIILGALTPGDRVTEAQLSEQLGVSRPTVREALNALAEEGLIVKESYRGLRVAKLAPDAFHDIALGRIALDMLAVDDVLADETGEKFAVIERGWMRYENAVFHPDPVVQHDAHLEFHRCLWDASGNYLLEKLWPVTAAQLTIALAEDQRRRADPEREHRVHLTLMEALRTRDRAVIRTAISAHTLESADEIVRMMREEEDRGR
ncbi:GntR family transcriptional regulator [Leucobacter weissii]|uniref:GntR family transcriptional regulator n=1 Tax=Leucobacter weissii TaxID=1983706 RepID=A0A939MIY3_9MICO|nr:GntR family transcriptional regulator [Leucobacter weissii]MBO1901583.1 GntR family transcriptional regulator [Leucobacter weissii]